MPVIGIQHPIDESEGEWVTLSPEARRQGVYMIGTTGTGKSTLLKSIALQDMVDGEGFCLIDPHGDLVDSLLPLVPPSRRDDVILFAPGDHDQRDTPLGLNILGCDRSDDAQVQRVTSTVIDTLRKLFSYSWGPRMEDLLRNSILTLMATPNTTLLDLWLLLASKRHREKYVSHVKDEYLKQFWDVQFAAYTRSSRDLIELVGSSLNKIGRFLADPRIRRIVAQPTTSFSLRHIMDNRKILLVNLSKGDLGEDNSSLLGSVLMNLILIAALTRRDTPVNQRVPFHVLVDEFQSYATSDTFSILQSEARKYALDTIVAHQYRDQLDDLNRGSTLNVANFIVFRVSGIDSHELASQFDNTPPPPEYTFQPIQREITEFPGVYRPMPETQKIALPRRAYSDVEKERANALAKQDNYRAQARLVVGHRMQEFDVYGGEPEAIPSLNQIVPDPTTPPYIRRKSRDLGMTKQDIDRLIKNRIGNRVEFDYLDPDVMNNIEETNE